MSLGVIGYPLGGERITPYAELSPALVWTRWSLEGGPYDSDFGDFVPGLRAGLGMHFPLSPQLKFDVGILYLLSGSERIKSQEMRELANQDWLEGLSQFAPFAQLTLTL